MPKRIQLKRTKGWRLPPNTVVVSRPGRWGNPRRAGQLRGYTNADAVEDFELWLRRDPMVRSFENVYGPPPTRREIRCELAGKNLACWCKPGAPCHADVLLRIANSKR